MLEEKVIEAVEDGSQITVCLELVSIFEFVDPF